MQLQVEIVRIIKRMNNGSSMILTQRVGLRWIIALIIFTASNTASLSDKSSCSLIADALIRLRCFESDVASSEAASIFEKIVSSPAALVACLAALLAFVSGVLGPAVQLRIGKLQAAAAKLSAEAAMLAASTAGLREIGKLRLTWMDKLRETLSEFHSILMSQDDDKMESKILQKLSELGTQLDLLLNQDDPRQKRLWQIADDIYQMKTAEERYAWDKPLIEAGRAVLDAEWEKVKTEMRGGAFQTGQ